MNVGASIRTLPTVRPKLYAEKVGTIAIKNDGEVGVLIAGRIVWFLEREIEECQNGSSSGVTVGEGAKSARGQGGGSPLSQSTPRDARTSSCSGQGGEGSGKGLGTQERAREGQEVGAMVPRPPRGEPGGPPEALAIDSRGVKPPERESSPKPLPRPSRGSGDLTGLNPGERGPGGGVVARCEGCRELWERPRQRGRPSLNCPRCR